MIPAPPRGRDANSHLGKQEDEFMRLLRERGGERTGGGGHAPNQAEAASKVVQYAG